jgi:hypothetical protein
MWTEEGKHVLLSAFPSVCKGNTFSWVHSHQCAKETRSPECIHISVQGHTFSWVHSRQCAKETCSPECIHISVQRKHVLLSAFTSVCAGNTFSWVHSHQCAKETRSPECIHISMQRKHVLLSAFPSVCKENTFSWTHSHQCANETWQILAEVMKKQANSMVQSPWEVENRWAGERIPCLLWNSKVQYWVHRNAPLNPIRNNWIVPHV